MDKELNEKAKVQDPSLSVHDFRFLSMTAGKQSNARGLGSGTLEERAEAIEIEQSKEGLKADTDKWGNYQRCLQVWQGETRQQYREDNKAQEEKISDFCNHILQQLLPGGQAPRRWGHSVYL